MSIEKALEALGEKLDRNSDLLEKVLNTGKGGTADEDAPRSRRRAAADDGADAAPARTSRRGADAPVEDEPPARRRRGAAAEEEAEPEGRKGKGDEEEAEPPRRRRAAAAEEEAPARGRAKKAAKLKIGDVRAAFADFLDVKNKKEEENRRAFIEEVLDFLKVDKTTDIAEADFQGAIDCVKAYADADDPNDVEIKDYFK